jgi:hypothetical protein
VAHAPGPAGGDLATSRGEAAAGPELEAKTLLEHFAGREPWNLSERHLRTLQRRVAQWRLQNGPDKEVFFAQDRVAGKAMQLDFKGATRYYPVRLGTWRWIDGLMERSATRRLETRRVWRPALQWEPSPACFFHLDLP